MKQLKCEMCGSTDLIKEDGVFVCQSCGTKYSVEEAKKMMVEGTVEVAGTVKVDNSDELANLYQIARRAKDDNNNENAQKYYDMILVKDPNSWEASFYVVYFKAMGCKIGQIQSAAISVNNCIDTVLKLILENVTDPVEQEKAISEVTLRVTNISIMLYNAAGNHYNGIDPKIRSNYVQEYANNSSSCTKMMYNLGNQLVEIFGDKLGTVAASVWKQGITEHLGYIHLLNNKELNKNIIMEYADKVKKYDTSYTAPTVNTSSAFGCYVATAVYGSYDCPQVWTLRRFRDYKLAETWYGREFIKIYYAISPTLVKWFGNTNWFKKVCRGPLDKMVANLRNKGIEDTPYNDRLW